MFRSHLKHENSIVCMKRLNPWDYFHFFLPTQNIFIGAFWALNFLNPSVIVSDK